MLFGGDWRVLSWSADGRSLFVGGTAYTQALRFPVLQYDLASGRVAASIDAAGDSITDLVALPGGDLAFTSFDGSWGLIAQGKVSQRVGASVATVRGNAPLDLEWMLNVWASWCTPSCLEEHPLLVDWARRPGAVRVLGLNHKDAPANATAWLGCWGNPSAETLVDGDGRLGIELSVYGTPETFVIDKAGIVSLKHVGPLTP